MTKQLDSLMGKMKGLSLLPLSGCFDSCYDQTQTYGLGTRIWNLSDRPVELQIRVGSILKNRGGNEPNQLEQSSRLDSTIDSLNLVHEPNEPNLS